MQLHWVRAAALGLAALSTACPRSGSRGPGSGDPKAPPPPPAVPVVLNAHTIAPMSLHKPDAISPVLTAMLAENQRWASRLETVPDFPAHYVAYHVYDKHNLVLQAEAGSLVADDISKERALHVEVRVGNPQLDSRRPLKDQQLAQLTSTQRLGVIPFGEDAKAIRHHLWLETDRRYREAAMMYRLVRTQEQMIKKSKEVPPDFSTEKAEVFIQPIAELDFKRDHWEQRVRECSKRVRKGVATRGTCRVDLELNTVYFVNSDGSQVQRSWTNSRLMVSVGIRANDGMPLSRVEQRFSSRIRTVCPMPPKSTP